MKGPHGVYVVPPGQHGVFVVPGSGPRDPWAAPPPPTARGDRDDRDDDDDIDTDARDNAQEDLDEIARGLGDLSLKPQQRAALAKLRADADRQIASAKQQLGRLESSLRAQLANPAASDADISNAIDAVTAQEGAIRKARVLEWVNARRVLDDAQRSQVEHAAKGKTR
jgi:hypothetical protein